MTRTHAKPGPGRGVYGISVAAELVGMARQSLRLYEQRGLLEPARSTGGTRRYSSEDLQRLHRISELLATGVNLTGVAMVLDLQDTNARLRADLNATRPDSDQTSRGHNSSPQPDGTPWRIPASDSAATHRGPSAPTRWRPTARRRRSPA
jgi:MerR family transcriptional regulator/heat shock protein HspR